MKPYTIPLVTLLASVFVPLSPRSVGAQEIAPGLRIRSRALPTNEWRTGTLVRYGVDSLVMQRCPDCATEAQPWARITRVDVSEGTTSSLRNIAIGALAGGVLAAWITKRRVDRDVAGCSGGPCALAEIAVPIYGVLGAAGGAVLGALWRVETWREIYGEAPARD